MGSFWICCLVVSIQLVDSMLVKQANESHSAFLERLFSTNYDPTVNPNADNDNYTQVVVNMYVNSISEISEVNMNYAVSVYLRQIWRDPRFIHGGSNKTLTVNYKQFDRLWVPDIYIRNEKNGRFHDITVPNRLIQIKPDGYVIYSQRVSMDLTCNMYLIKYPMDNQTCYVELESYGSTAEDLVYVWGGPGGGFENGTLILAEFDFTGNDLDDCTETYSIGTFSCIRAILYFNRKFSYYLFHIYIPSTLVVILSWVSFWIDIESVPARISLGLLTVLTMTTQSSGVSARLPRVSYIKAIDVWMSVCLVFVFAALVEYSIVNVLSRRRKRRLEAQKVQANGTTKNDLDKTSQSDLDTDISSRKCTWCNCRKLLQNEALLVETIARILFPLVFLIFNLGYWVSYLHLLV